MDMPDGAYCYDVWSMRVLDFYTFFQTIFVRQYAF